MSNFVIDRRSYVFRPASAVQVQNGVYSYSDFSFLGLPPSAVYATISMSHFHCSNTLYTVRQDVNDALVVDMQRLVLAPGWYSISTLCAAVETLVRTVRASATCTYDAQSGRVTIASGDRMNLTVLGAPASTCFALLGMLPNRTYSGESSYTFENVADLQPVKTVVVASNVTLPNRFLGAGQSFLACVPVTAPPLGLISYDSTDEVILQPSWQQGLFNLSFVDQSGAPLTFQSEWMVVVKLSVYHDAEQFRGPPPLSFQDDRGVYVLPVSD